MMRIVSWRMTKMNVIIMLKRAMKAKRVMKKKRARKAKTRVMQKKRVMKAKTRERRMMIEKHWRIRWVDIRMVWD